MEEEAQARASPPGRGESRGGGEQARKASGGRTRGEEREGREGEEIRRVRDLWQDQEETYYHDFRAGSLWYFGGYAGINTKEFAKKCSKKFACSCNNVNDDKVQIQGDISEVIVEFLEKEFEIKEKYIVDMETYKKKMEKEEKKNPKKEKVEEKGEGKGEEVEVEKKETKAWFCLFKILIY